MSDASLKKGGDMRSVVASLILLLIAFIALGLTQNSVPEQSYGQKPFVCGAIARFQKAGIPATQST